MSDPNPYAVSPNVIEPPSATSQMNLASQNQRFLTVLLDNLILWVVNSGIGFVLGSLLVATSGEQGISQSALSVLNILSYAIGISVILLYYIAMESFTGKTIGKYVVGTKVVNESGGTPTLQQIIGRSFCRLIPFEALSFLGNKGFPIGWHDRIPGTRVVKHR